MAVKKTKVVAKQKSDSKPLARKTVELTLMTGQTKEDQVLALTCFAALARQAGLKVYAGAPQRATVRYQKYG